MTAENTPQRLAWAITGSGHFVPECLALLQTFDNVDLFLSRAAAEVLQMYGHRVSDLRRSIRVFRDTTASSVPVGLLYDGAYHTLVIAPATSNTVAKCVWGISDTLVTNMYAQAGKCRIPSIVFACDTGPELQSEAPGGRVTVYPRRIDLENVAKLREFEATQVVSDMEELRRALRPRRSWPKASCS
jgi:dihydromethanopterin reductase (acceptor)